MKRYFNLLLVGMSSILMTACGENKSDFKWQIDRFDDINILRYRVEGFDQLSLKQKQFVYYLGEAALCGRDILFDQNFKYNLPIRRTLEAAYTHFTGDRTTDEFRAFEKYLKKVWFANGIHHHYSLDKFTPEFSRDYFEELLTFVPAGEIPEEGLLGMIREIIFNPGLYAKRVEQSAGADMLTQSACNYYDGVTQEEAETFYEKMADSTDLQPISYGLNSQLTKDPQTGEIYERTWKVDGMYGQAISEIVKWLELAQGVAENDQQAAYIETLIAYYRSGDLNEFDKYSIQWVQDTLSEVDFINGFIEVYGDPLGYKASWESLVNFKNFEATKTTEVISNNAQWFEDHSPIDPKYRKPKVKGVSAKVITAAMLGGDCYPATPIGINLPNADWIRRDYGSKSVTIENITSAYTNAAQGNGFTQEFVLRPEDRELRKKWGTMGSNLHTDLHECLGHGSGQLARGIKGDELKNYGSALEEARADLFALYYMMDPKLVELGIIPTLDVAKAEYNQFMMNGLMTQLTRIQPGKNIEQAHMRNRALVANWVHEKSKEHNAVEIAMYNGKSYVIINNYEKVRELFGELLREVQRIKSEGDYEAGKALVENYGIQVNPILHAEVLSRYQALDIAPYSGFVNPKYTLITDNNGEVKDVKIEYAEDYAAQMLEYSKNYSFLPDKN